MIEFGKLLFVPLREVIHVETGTIVDSDLQKDANGDQVEVVAVKLNYGE